METHILKSKIYEESGKNDTSSNDFLNTNLSQILFKFKKVVSIIFKFNLYKKRILFLGTPYFLNNGLKNTNHTGISTEHCVRGLKLSAHARKSRYNSGNNGIPCLIKKAPHLIIAFSKEKKESGYNSIIKQAIDQKIPVIEFAQSSETGKNPNNAPFILVNMTNSSFYKRNYNTFFSIINAVLKIKSQKIINLNVNKKKKR